MLSLGFFHEDLPHGFPIEFSFFHRAFAKNLLRFFQNGFSFIEVFDDFVRVHWEIVFLPEILAGKGFPRMDGARQKEKEGEGFVPLADRAIGGASSGDDAFPEGISATRARGVFPPISAKLILHRPIHAFGRVIAMDGGAAQIDRFLHDSSCMA